MFSIKQVWQDIRATRTHIIVATLLFVISAYIGATNESFQQYLNSQLNAMGDLVETINNSSNPTLAMFMVIFLNNAIKAALVIAFGAFFGLFPIFFLTINGLIIGFVIKLASSGNMRVSASDWEIVLKTLVPHGILEIPALIIAGAYGLRLGKLLFSTLGALLFDQNKLDTIGRSYKETLKRCGVMTVYMTVVLLIASIIESTFTMWLASTIN